MPWISIRAAFTNAARLFCRDESQEPGRNSDHHWLILTIAVAVAEADGEVRSLGVIPNRTESISRLIRKLGKPEQLRVCYEGGPTGYVLYWRSSELGVKCEVVAPMLVPVKAGDRVKADRRDAQKLARSCRAGDLTPVWVPEAAHEALRDLVRARLAAKRDQLRA